MGRVWNLGAISNRLNFHLVRHWIVSLLRWVELHSFRLLGRVARVAVWLSKEGNVSLVVAFTQELVLQARIIADGNIT